MTDMGEDSRWAISISKLWIISEMLGGYFCDMQENTELSADINNIVMEA